MSLAVAEMLTRESTSPTDEPRSNEDPNQVTDHKVIVGNFRPASPTTAETEKESSGKGDTSYHGKQSYHLEILDLSPSRWVLTTVDRSANSTADTERPESLTEELQRIFTAAKEEIFEDGMDSVFSRRLVKFMENYNRLAIDILSELLIPERVNAEVAGEALRHVGYSEDVSTRIPRRRLLEHCLFGSSARIRDGAILGIAAMNDPRAIPFVEQAICRELIPELRRDMCAVLEQLHETNSKA